MGGLGILVLLVGYICLGWLIVHSVWHTGRRRRAVGFLVTIAALPFADAVAGRLYLRAQCDDPTRVVINRTINDVDGIYVHSGQFDDSPDYYGYSWVAGTNGTFERRALRAPDGYAAHYPPRFPYELIEEPRQESVAYYQTRKVIRVRESGEELAIIKRISFRGGWAERIAMAFSDAGPRIVAECGSYDELYKELLDVLHKTLRPSAHPQPFASGDAVR